MENNLFEFIHKLCRECGFCLWTLCQGWCTLQLA